MERLFVKTAKSQYPIYIGKDIYKSSQLLPKFDPRTRILVVTNETVANLYLTSFCKMLSGFDVRVLHLPDGERHKNLSSIELIMDELIDNGFDRRSILVALGGGIIGDMTGFAAAIYQRGIEFIQVPTTLLAQVDSSVGGKTAVNHPLGKNMIGAFHQPIAVFADIATLASLPAKERAAGFAEIIKYGAILDREFFDYLEHHQAELWQLEEKAMITAIKRSCEIKADIVARDEREADIRAILNFGHTFGHAIEAFTQYKTYLHGEAVAIGMVMAADLSLRHGWISGEFARRLKQLIQRFHLPTTAPADMTVEDFESIMLKDKKTQYGRLRLILLDQHGAQIREDFDPNLLRETITAGEEACAS